MYEIETYEHEGVPVALYQDDIAGNPFKEWDQASEILLGDRLAREYDLGERCPRTDEEAYRDSATMCRYLTMFGGYALAIPFSFNDYGSGGARVTLFTPGEEVASGFLVLSQKAYQDEFGAYDMPLTGDAEFTAEKTCRAEFASFKAWVEGEVYGFVAGVGREDEEACFGYYGDLPYVRSEANSQAHWIAEERKRLRALPWMGSLHPVAS